MGYDLHITRAEEWIDNEACEISKEEGLTYVESDPELALVPENGDSSADGIGDSTDDEPGFDWLDGNIPDRATFDCVIES